MAVGCDEAIDAPPPPAWPQPEDHRQAPGPAEVFGDPQHRSRSHQHSARAVTGRLEPDHRIDVRELWMLLDHAVAERTAERGEVQFAGRVALQHELNARGAKAAGPVVQEHWGHRVVPDSTP